MKRVDKKLETCHGTAVAETFWQVLVAEAGISRCSDHFHASFPWKHASKKLALWPSKSILKNYVATEVGGNKFSDKIITLVSLHGAPLSNIVECKCQSLPTTRN